MPKLLFIPVSVLGGLLAGLISQKIFDRVWGAFDDQDAPEPKYREIAYGKLIVALLIQGALFRLVKGLFDHAARRGFANYTGAWPGEEAPESS